jgi:hypothetical protein
MRFSVVIVGVLAAVFATAGALKVFHPLETVQVAAFLLPGFRPDSNVLMLVPGLVGGFEIAVAILLLATPYRSATLVVAMATLAVFTAVLGVLAQSPGAPSCGCFGPGRGLGTGNEAAGGILRNLGLICLAGWVRGHERHVAPRTPPEASTPERA